MMFKPNISFSKVKVKLLVMPLCFQMIKQENAKTNI